MIVLGLVKRKRGSWSRFVADVGSRGEGALARGTKKANGASTCQIQTLEIQRGFGGLIHSLNA